MNHTRHVLLMSTFGALILIMCGFLFGLNVSHPLFFTATRPMMMKPVASTVTPLVIVSKKDVSSPIFVYSYEYPQFPNASVLFNDAIASYVNSAVVQFKQNATANWQARVDTSNGTVSSTPAPDERFLFQLTWTPSQINSNYISIALRLDAYDGGAHGHTEIKTFNYDLRTNHILFLADLYAGNPNYLAEVASSSRSILREDLISAGGKEGFDEAMLEEGTRPTAENFADFTFTDHQITLYFGEYQVAPYVFGPQTVTLQVPVIPLDPCVASSKSDACFSR